MLNEPKIAYRNKFLLFCYRPVYAVVTPVHSILLLGPVRHPSPQKNKIWEARTSLLRHRAPPSDATALVIPRSHIPVDRPRDLA